MPSFWRVVRNSQERWMCPARICRVSIMRWNFYVHRTARMRERGERNRLSAEGKRVVIIGGGDTGSDCVGIANRQGAASILQIDRNTKLPETIDKSLVWPYWPKQFTISSSQEEGCERDFRIQTKRIEGKRGKVEKIIACRVNSVGGRYMDEPGSEFSIEADMVLLAMGFAGQPKRCLMHSVSKGIWPVMSWRQQRGKNVFRPRSKKCLRLETPVVASRWLSGHCTKAGNARQRSIVF